MVVYETWHGWSTQGPLQVFLPDSLMGGSKTGPKEVEKGMSMHILYILMQLSVKSTFIFCNVKCYMWKNVYTEDLNP